MIKIWRKISRRASKEKETIGVRQDQKKMKSTAKIARENEKKGRNIKRKD